MKGIGNGTTAQLRKLALNKPDEGISVLEAARLTENSSQSIINLLSQSVRKGTLFQVKAKKKNESRWFALLDDAKRYAAKHGGQLKYTKSPEVTPPTDTTKLFAPPKIRSVGPAHMAGDPVILPKTKVVRARGYEGDKRFEVREASRVIDSNEARPWALNLTSR